MSKILIEKENIYLDLPTMNLEDALKLSGEKLIEAGYVTEGYIDSLLQREKLATTYMDAGIAIPHGDTDANQFIIQSGICVLQFKNGINFGKGNIAKLLIATAGKGNNHLKILASIAKTMKDKDIVLNLQSTDEIDYVFNKLSKYIK